MCELSSKARGPLNGPLPIEYDDTYVMMDQAALRCAFGVR